jgi:threonine/homoserine/homoserine lactone efflux protein
MFGTQHLGLFISAGLLLNMTPGPDTMYILGRTIAQGRSAGIASVLGISTGCMVHTLAAGLGLSAILVGFALAFSCVKIVGAGYLIYLGIGLLRTEKGGLALHGSTPKIRSPFGYCGSRFRLGLR